MQFINKNLIPKSWFLNIIFIYYLKLFRYNLSVKDAYRFV